LFLLFTIASLAVIAFGLMHGEPKKLMQPYDPDHNGCGLGETL